MSWGPSEVQKAVYALLANDATLTTLLGGAGRVFDFVPQDSSYPYLTMFIKPFQDRGNATGEGLQCEFQITTWARGNDRGDKAVQAIQDRIDQLLHKTSLVMTGWAVTCLRRSFVDILTMDDNVTKQGIQRFKLQLGDK